jgi:hypothetical protein
MPLFVWFAIAIAILLIGGGAATAMVAQPVKEALNGPIGYLLTFGIIAIVAMVIWCKTRDQNKDIKK